MTAEKLETVRTMSGQGAFHPAQTNDGGWQWPAATAGTARHVYGHPAGFE